MNTTLNKSVYFVGLCLILAILAIGYLGSFKSAHAQTATTTATSTPTIIITPISTINLNPSIPLCEIQRSLRIGSTGADVKCLQRFLNYAGYSVALTGLGSVGNESTYFGPATQSAVIRWQNANASQVLAPSGLTAGTGNFGPASFGYYVKLVLMAFGLSSI